MITFSTLTHGGHENEQSKQKFKTLTRNNTKMYYNATYFMTQHKDATNQMNSLQHNKK